MSESRASSRRRRPVIDPRLLIGVALVVASVAGVLTIVGVSDRRVTVYAAAATLAPGQQVDATDLVVRRVAIEDARSLYLTDDDLRRGALVATGVVRRGELVPRSAVGSVEGTASTALVLQLAGRVSESVVAGASVDIWSSAGVAVDGDIAAKGYGPPIVIAPEATVVRVVEDDGFASAGDGQSVEVLVPRSQIARLLQAIADGDALAVVPAGIPLVAR